MSWMQNREMLSRRGVALQRQSLADTEHLAHQVVIQQPRNASATAWVVLCLQGSAGTTRVLFRRTGNTSITEVMDLVAASRGSGNTSANAPAQQGDHAVALQAQSLPPAQAAVKNPLDEAPRWVQLSPTHLEVEPDSTARAQLSYSAGRGDVLP